MKIGAIFIIHPISGKVYSVKEASEEVGVPSSTITGRIRRGDRGLQIWRPSNTKASEYSSTSLYTVDNTIKYADQEEYYT